ncbi:MAG: site-specific integrase [Bacteroidales bacterium]|nr:site-specific integrase [Bacteroidales bacterium]
MASVNYIVRGKKRKLVPIYVRFLSGRDTDFLVNSGLKVNPAQWSNRTQSLRQRIKTDADEDFLKKLSGLKDHLNNEIKVYAGEYSKDWLTSVIESYHSISVETASTLNGFIEDFISRAERGEVKNKNALNYAAGTLKGLRGFQRVFNMYQGVYTAKDLSERKEKKKPIRPKKILDFEDITITFYKNFVRFLTDEGYKTNTIGKFIKLLKFVMNKALAEGKHKNRQFQDKAFSGFTEDSHAVYLTTEEIDRIYNYDLSKFPRMELARDAFICLCETALRVSDYRKIDLNIRERHGEKYIFISQTKTSEKVIIPLSARMEALLNKYQGSLPRIPEQHVNRHIKTICAWCKIDETITWETQKYGKKYEKSAKKYELVTCHTGRRSAATNMYLAGILVRDIMKITGHRTEEVFNNYIRVTEEETAERLAGHPYFRRNKLSIAK